LSRDASKELEVLAVALAPVDSSLRGRYLGFPKAGEAVDSRHFLLRGWVLPQAGPALGVEIVRGEQVVVRIPVGRRRADIAAAHPDLAHAASSGFEQRLNLLAVGGEVELAVRAVLSPVERVPLATFAVRAPAERAERVSVVIPCFNQAHFLAEAIESVLAQTHAGIEIVVVDDGSRDNTVEVAGRYPGVRYLRQVNRGLAAARNAGLAEVEGEFVLFLDSDDRLLPGAIASGLRELHADPAAVMAAGAWRLIGEDGEQLPASPPQLPEDAYPALLEGCFISTPAAVLYRRRLFDQVGGFDSAVDASADYDLYLRAAARHLVRTHDDVVAEYRRHGANMTRNAGLIMRAETTVLRRQSAVVAGRAELTRARERGLRRSRAYHGAHMVDEVRRLADEGRRDEALRVVATRARLDPRAAPGALRALGRRGLR
jgi:hypothetical protein